MSHPKDATHKDAGGYYYKAGEELNWLRWSDSLSDWYIYGTVKAGEIRPLKGAPVAPQPQIPTLPEGYVAQPDYTANQIADAFSVPPAPQPLRPSEAEKWPCATQLPEAFVIPYTNYFAQYRFVGSRITCNPPPLDTDQDVLVYVQGCNMAVVQDKLLNAGFVREGSNPADMQGNADNQSVFHSFRKGDMNYIITSEMEFYERFSTATELARKWNLLEKADRIQLFQAVLYGKWRA